MKHVHYFIKRSEINRNCGCVSAATYQGCNLRRDRAGRGGKVGRRCFVSKTKKWNRYPPCWLIASAWSCSSAICSAATVSIPRLDPDPVSVASTPILNTRRECDSSD